jgi:hypothetical protein
VYNANQIIALPKNLLRLIAGARATAIIGIWMSCDTNMYNLFEQINHFTNKKGGIWLERTVSFW